MTRHGGGAEVLFRRRQEVEVVEAVLAGDEGRGVAGLAYHAVMKWAVAQGHRDDNPAG